jgi:hypothetical protein
MLTHGTDIVFVHIYTTFALSLSLPLSLSFSLSRARAVLPSCHCQIFPPSLLPPYYSHFHKYACSRLMFQWVLVGVQGLGFSPSTTYTHAPMLAHTLSLSLSSIPNAIPRAHTHTLTHRHIARSLALSRAHSRSLSPNTCRHPRGIREHINNMMKTF